MTTCIRHIIVALVMASFAFAQPAPKPKPKPKPSDTSFKRGTLQGRWDVAYGDAMLGLIKGEAVTNQDGTEVTVTVSPPKSTLKYELKSTSIKWKGDDVTIELKGQSPHSKRIPFTQLHDLPRVLAAPKADKLIVRVEDSEASIPLVKIGSVGTDQVTVNLKQNKDGALTGTWTHRVHAVSERDLMGIGRVGRFKHETVDGVLYGRQTGDEAWTRRAPKIDMVIVINDQLGREHGLLKTTYADSKKDERGNVTHKPNSGIRTLLVIGRNLPQRVTEPHELVSMNPDQIKYRIRAYGQSSKVLRPFFDDGWKRLRDMLSAGGVKGKKLNEVMDRFKERDVLLLRADVKARTMPGNQVFTLNGAKGEWPLRFGDNSAKFGFARMTSEVEQEFIDTVFSRETIYVRLISEHDTPVKEIPVVIGINDQVHTFQRMIQTPTAPVVVPIPILLLSRVGPVEVWDSRKTGKPAPIVYMSPPITVYPAGTKVPPAPKGGFTMPVEMGNELNVKLGRTDLFNATPTLAKAWVHNTPAELGTTWKEALAKAARCADIEFSDFNTLSNEKVEEISNFIITEWETKKIRVTVADHAAMLLLREEFLRLMKKQRAEYRHIEGIAMLRAFGEQIRPHADNKQSPFSRIEITAPNGHPLGVGAIFMEKWVMEYFKLDWEQYRKWADGALQEAINKIRENVNDAIEEAEEIEDCEVGDLLELTAYGFDAVAEKVVSRLVKLEEFGTPKRQRWVPDKAGRAAVRGLGRLGRAVRALDDYAEFDTIFVLVAATAAVMPVGWVGEAALFFSRAGSAMSVAAGQYTSAVYAGALVIDAADVGFALLHEVPEYFKRKSDTQFQRGAMMVTGTAGLDEAIAREKSELEVLVAIGGAGLGTFGSAANLARSLKELKRAKSLRQLQQGGEAATDVMKGGNLSRFEKLTDEQKMMFAHHAAEAKRIKAELGEEALTESQRAALKITDDLHAEARAAAKSATSPEAPGAPRDVAVTPDRTVPPTHVDPESPGLIGRIEGKGRKPVDQPTTTKPPKTPGDPDGPVKLPPKDPDGPVRLPTKDPDGPVTLPPKSTKDPVTRPPESAAKAPDDPGKTTTIPARDPGSRVDLPPRRDPYSAPPPRDPGARTMPTPRPRAPRAPPRRDPFRTRPPPDSPAPVKPPRDTDTPVKPPRDPDTPVKPPRDPDATATVRPNPDTTIPPARSPRPTTTARVPRDPDVPPVVRPRPTHPPKPAVPDAPKVKPKPVEFNPAETKVARGSDDIAPMQADLEARMAKAKQRLERLKANNGSAKSKAYAKDRLDDLEQRQDLLKDLMAEAKAGKVKLTQSDIDWLTGKRRALTPAEETQARRVLAEEFDGWADATKLARGSALDRLKLQRLGAYRKAVVDRLLNEVMGEIGSKVGGKLERQAFGSTNLTSDYDLSIKGPGAERVIGEFNRRFRARFGKESGSFFDTNVYTDPVYRFIDPESTVGRRLTPKQHDTVRQFMYEQMANAKYMDAAQWEKHAARLIDNAPDGLKDTMRRLLGEVETKQAAAERAFNDELRRAGYDPAKIDADTELRFRNEMYARSLDKIDQLRRFSDELGKMAKGELPDLDVLDELVGARRGVDAMNTPIGRELTEYYALRRAGKTAEADELLKDIRASVNSHLRHHQGNALYYASEAYQTQGTIGHVVGELQAGGRAKKLTGADLLKPPDPKSMTLTRGQYSSSFFENNANLYKELNGIYKKLKKAGLATEDNLADALTSQRTLASVEDAEKAAELAEKAAIKTSKYFVRQLDAAHRAGVDLVKALPEDLHYVIENTVDLERVRGKPKEFAKLLEDLGKTPGEYVRDSLRAADELAARLARNSPLDGLKKDLADHYAEVDRAVKSAGGETVNLPRKPDAFKTGRFERPDIDASTHTFDPARTSTVDPEATGSFVRSDPGDGPRPRIEYPGETAPPPVRKPPNPPQAKRTWKAADGDEYELDEQIGSGAFSDVYGLKGAKERAIKFAKRDEAFGRDDDVTVVPARQTVLNDKAISDELAKAGIRQLRVLKAGDDVDNPYLIVERLKKGQQIIRKEEIAGLTRDQMIENGIWSVDHEKAMVELYAELGRKGFIWEDGHIHNVFFETVDGKLVAGVLDHGRLAKFDDLDPMMKFWLDEISFAPKGYGVRSHAAKALPDRQIKNAHEFMAKMLEHKGWIRFNEQTGQFEPRRMHPDSIDREMFDLESFLPPRADGNTRAPANPVFDEIARLVFCRPIRLAA